MAGNNESQEFVYRISTADEWSELQTNRSTFGQQLDKDSQYIHLSKLDQIDCQKLGDGLIYEDVDGSNVFPHFYGPSRSFVPLTLDMVVKAESIILSDGKFTCSMLN